MSRISNLSQSLVAKYGISQQQADEFVTNLFAVIRENVKRDRIVKVKGLGTFKLAEVSARESIDVNTGERITIEGRNKLSFTPENAVRDLINSPFSQFESVEIDDESILQGIDEKYNQEEEPMDDTSAELPVVPVAEEPEAVIPEVAASFDQESASAESLEVPAEQNDAPVAIEAAPVEPKDEPAAPETAPAAPQDASVAQEESPFSPNPAPAAQEDEPVVPDEMPAAPEAEKAPQTTRSPYCENLIREDISNSRKIVTLLYWVIGLVILILLFMGGHFLYNMGKDHGAQKAAAENAIAVEPVAMPIDTPTDTLKNDSLTEKAEKDTVKVEQNAEVVVKTVKSRYDDIPDQTIYNKDARVKTGAYAIMGLDTIVTVRQGQTLKGITKAYLGEGMECYVEVFNGGITSVKPGDKIRIPKVKPKKPLKKKR